MSFNTEHYQSDFEVDKQIISNAADSSSDDEFRTLLWVTRRDGTHCVSERNVFVLGTHANYLWRHLYETREPFLVFVIELDGRKDGTIYGSLYEIDFWNHYRYVQKNALSPKEVKFFFESGKEETTPYNGVSSLDRPGAESYILLPEDGSELHRILQEVKNKRQNEYYTDWVLRGFLQSERSKNVMEM